MKKAKKRRPLASSLTSLEIANYVQALHWWTDRGIERGLTDEEIVKELKVMTVVLHPRTPMLPTRSGF